MMHQDEFPAYHSVYKQLCLEKVKFPNRDPNMRMVMESICKDSPMYEYVEQLNNKEIKQPMQQ